MKHFIDATLRVSWENENSAIWLLTLKRPERVINPFKNKKKYIKKTFNFLKKKLKKK